MTTVAIHTYPGSLPLRGYLLWHLGEEWRRRGLRVEVVVGARPVAAAQVAILHVDLTRVPDDYLALWDAYPALVNGRVADIGKRRFAQLRVRPDDDYGGAVIVKTNRNMRGIPERIAMRATQGPPARLWGAMLDHLFPSRPTGRRWHTYGSYPVYRSMAEVPGWVWRRPDLVVQRFVPERGPDGFVVRYWYVLGDAECSFVGHFSNPVSTIPALTRLERGDPPPSEVRAIQQAWSLDFGSVNYVVCEGEPIVLDVNKTVGFDHRLTPWDAVPGLSRGIERWCPPDAP